MEHGFQSNYYDYYDLVTDHNQKVRQLLSEGKITDVEAIKNTLKFVFGAEAYWVKDRFEKDRTNCHIILLSKNEEGRRDINGALSEANISGFYGQPRLDMDLLLKIKPENVLVTTACIKYWAYDDIDEITMRLFDHFQENFYLEVQCHNTEAQKRINGHIMDLHYKHGIDIMCGLDSHYINPEDYIERNNYLEGRGIVYDEDEIGWYMDYPSDEQVLDRLLEQNVLNKEEAQRSMDNTDILLDFDDITFNTDIKLPSIYPDKSQEWKDEKLKIIVMAAWEQEKQHVPEERWPEYEDGINYELSAIINTHMADYFLLDHKLVQRGIEKGGIITRTGRGSGVSYYVNSLLGFSNIDRFISPVKLYPDRFMSETRILKTRSLPDLDLNLGNPEVFAEAQDEILTEAYGSSGHSYPMISYKPLQKSSAFKLYAKSQGLDFSIANNITACIAKYEKALKHADSPEDKENINIYDFVPEKYHHYLDESKKYHGIINAKSQAPCGYLIYQGDIKREIGLIRCVSGTGKNQHSVLTTVVDGAVAEKYKFVKNDLLKVDVWLAIYSVFDKIGIPTPTVTEITKLIDNDKATWDIYRNGYTCCINQCESDFGRQCSKRYSPRNMQELTALVAALRPGFKTQLNTFLDRKPYTTGIKVLDGLLKDSFHYIMYQENIMTYLGWLGIEQTETYAIIKKISKKKFKDKELAELKARLIEQWKINTGSEAGFEDTWAIMEAFSKYAFNASHSVSYAYDSVYGAYAKAHYPYEFYCTMLQIYTDKGDKDRVAKLRSEMKAAFNINEGSYKFGLDNRQFTIDKARHCINPSLSSIKGIGGSVAEELYTIKDCGCKNFVDLLLYMRQNTKISRSVICSLIKIDYFSDFGNINELTHILNTFDCVYDKTNERFKKQISKKSVGDYGLTDEIVSAFSHKQTEKTYLMVDMYGMLLEMLNVGFVDYKPYIKASFQQKILKRATITDPNASGVCIIGNVNEKSKTPAFEGYSLKNGTYNSFKVPKKVVDKKPLEEGDVIMIKGFKWDFKKMMDENGKWINSQEKELWITEFAILPVLEDN